MKKIGYSTPIAAFLIIASLFSPKILAGVDSCIVDFDSQYGKSGGYQGTWYYIHDHISKEVDKGDTICFEVDGAPSASTDWTTGGGVLDNDNYYSWDDPEYEHTFNNTGTYYVYAYVNADSNSDRDERHSWKITVIEKKPDLDISSFSAPSKAATNSQIEVSWRLG